MKIYSVSKHIRIFLENQTGNFIIKEAEVHPVREPARIALNTIREMLKSLGTKTNISAEKLAEGEATYKKLSQAIGILNNNIVDHDR